MKNTFKKIIACILSISMMLTIIPSTVFANNLDDDLTNVETYMDYDLGVTIKRGIDSDGNVVVTMEKFDGSEKSVVVNDNGSIYVDGVFVFDASDLDLFSVDSDSPSFSTYSINWGSWQSSNTRTINVRGYSNKAALGAFIASLFGFLPLATCLEAANLILAFSPDYVDVKVRTRYGSDSTYFYYERETTFYDSSSGRRIAGPYRDSGREFL